MKMGTGTTSSRINKTLIDNTMAYLAIPPEVISAGKSLEDDGFDASGFAQAVSGQVSHFVMMTLLAGAALLVQKRDNRTFQRQLTMPVRRSELLGAKITGRFSMGVIQFGIVFIAGAVFGMSYDGITLPIILVMVAIVLYITALTFVLSMFISTEQQAIAISTTVAITLAGLGEAWIPPEIMPDFMIYIGHFSPVAWAMDGFNALFFNNSGLEDIVVPVLVFLGLSVELFIIGISRFKYE